ncbi:MAG: ATP-dependent endonuclease [Hydrogenophilales bacterium CG17_big_fil_post_rev_8_21_14_2_50_63_12]|nr:MAG: ATP-dependent endonuclease [Hydrogenophilales bacterium CG17_big_fil_post_rev_8_21_14_2_50_63_12]
MYLHSYRIKNYRRLQDVHIELASDISIFVGSNNSGKTSATQALYAFAAGSKDKFSLYDFSSACWKDFDVIGNLHEGGEAQPELPSISLDLWFEVAVSDLYLVIPLLPSTAWQGTQVGIRIEFAPRNPVELLGKFRTVRTDAKKKAAALDRRENEKYVPWPKTLTDYLKNELPNEFEFKYYVLDRAQFDDAHKPQEGYEPLLLGKEPGGAAILKSLVKVDNLSAQRHLADPATGTGTGAGRAEDLSKRLSRFYKRNLDQRQEDHSALRALFDSETGLNEHLADVFKDTLGRISKLGYPGLHNPQLEIKSALNPATIMSSQDARVHYVLGDGADALRLPDTHNGLGFKNLIYMVVEILDLHGRWVADKEQRAPLHLIFIEEPEAHLHAQLQQVFIRNVLDLMKNEEDGGAFSSQTVVTTHSPHILYERGFQPIRYFRRKNIGGEQTTEVLNLSTFYSQTPNERDFLQRYLKLTHCDLFFADAVILVEGNVERLLLPVMIEKEAVSLRSACLSILEVGGAFGHRFKLLIEFLGLVALVITDLDSVKLVAAAEEDDDEDTEFEIPNAEAGQPPVKKSGKTCLPSEPDALTSNQTLIQWLPKKQTVAELLAATDAEKLHLAEGGSGFKVRVTYQVQTNVAWNGATASLCGRTLEEAFGLENAAWCQAVAQRHIGLKLRGNPATPGDLASGLHKRVSGKSFDKTKFALGVLTELPANWTVPLYIKDGLHWLDSVVSLELPAPLPEATEPAAAAAAAEAAE